MNKALIMRVFVYVSSMVILSDISSPLLLYLNRLVYVHYAYITTVKQHTYYNNNSFPKQIFAFWIIDW